MLIKDLENGEIFEYGNNSHDSLIISDDGRTLSYSNLQNGDGSRFGDYRFVMDDGEVPSESNTDEAMYGCCYAHIGYTDKGYEKGRADAIDEFVKYYKLNPCPPNRDDCDCTIEEYACLECMANYFKRRKKNDNNGTN